MKRPETILTKIYNLEELVKAVARWRFTGKTIAFTNGCFDLLHEGHIASLSQAASEADILVVGVNSDASTRRLKGNDRPINTEQSRALLLASMAIIDAVIVFDEDTPLQVIEAIMPDALVKGGDYSLDKIVGASQVMHHGGRVIINPIKPGFSTTQIIEKLRKQS